MIAPSLPERLTTAPGGTPVLARLGFGRAGAGVAAMLVILVGMPRDCWSADRSSLNETQYRDAGELRCDIADETEYGISAQRGLRCTYARARFHTELYEGSTGITGVGLGRAPALTLVYRVLRRSNPLATLAGEYTSDGSSVSTPDVLVGGPTSDIRLVRLSPTSAAAGAAPFYAPLNAVAGFGYLHLIYNGRLAGSARR